MRTKKKRQTKENPWREDLYRQISKVKSVKQLHAVLCFGSLQINLLFHPPIVNPKILHHNRNSSPLSHFPPPQYFIIYINKYSYNKSEKSATFLFAYIITVSMNWHEHTQILLIANTDTELKRRKVILHFKCYTLAWTIFTIYTLLS